MPDARKSSNDLLGVLVYTDQVYLSSVFFAGMAAEAMRLQISLVLHYFPSTDNEAKVDSCLPELMRSGAVRAAVLIYHWPTALVRELARRFHCVSLQHEYPGAPIDSIGADNTQAMTQLVNHLHDNGHRRIGFVGRCEEMSWANGRYLGYRDALRGRNLQFDQSWVVDVTLNEIEHYMQNQSAFDRCAEQVIQQMKQGVSAFMVANDAMGYELSRALARKGVRVPDDVSLTGFDGLPTTAPRGCPLLSSVTLPGDELGKAAIDAAMQRLQKPTAPLSNIRYPCELRPGQSVATI